MTKDPLISSANAVLGGDSPRTGQTAGNNGSGGSLPARLSSSRNFVAISIFLFLLHAFFMLYRYGQIPVAPVIGDEVIINDPAIALSHGQGLIAPSFVDSAVGIDRLYAHFPPIYLFTEALAFRAFGVSVYSLRLTTTVMDLLAVAAFLFLLWCLYRWRLAGWMTAISVAMIYTLNATVTTLHRIARMESMIELFLLIALTCVLRAIHGSFGVGDRESIVTGANAGTRHNGLYLAWGAVFAGLSMGTHPEALVGVIPILVMLAVAAPVRWGVRLLLLAVTGATPILIWAATYGRRSWHAFMEMRDILRYNTEPRPGIFSFAHDFFRETHRNPSQAMRATLFFLCLLVFEIILQRWASVESLYMGRRRQLSGHASKHLLLMEIFAASSLISLTLLSWFISASITRYEVIFPVYLIGIAIALKGVSASRPIRLAAIFGVGALTAVEILALSIHLHATAGEISDPHRFDQILSRVPPQMRVAAMPMLWLAFEQEHRPFTLLYRNFDGSPTWRAQNAENPLKQFDAVIVDTSFQTEFNTYSPYAAQGRQKIHYVIGQDQVDLYLRSK